MIKKIIFKLFPELIPTPQPPRHPIIALLDDEYGHELSKKSGKPVDKDNQPLPWFTYPAIAYLSSLDMSELDVLEWGSGNSSLFLSKRVKSIISIENHQEWYNHVVANKNTNQEIILADISDYEHIPESLNKKFNIVIIDGMKRYECAKQVHKYIKDDGIIILDNSDWYKNTAALIRGLDFIQVDFSGFGPVNMYPWTTSLFFSRKNHIQPIGNEQPHSPIGGLNHTND